MIYILALLSILIGTSYALGASDDEVDVQKVDLLDDSDPDFEDTRDRDDVVLDADGSVNLVDLGAGDDWVDTGDGADWVAAGPGDDMVRLGNGDDFAIADTGDLQSQAYFDPENADAYSAQISAAEDDTYSGDDTYLAGDGDDRIEDSLGSDYIRGQSGADDLSALDRDLGAPDTIEGGYNNDTLRGDDGDVLLGETGDDLFVLHSRDGADPIVVADFSPQEDLLKLVDESGNQLIADRIQDGDDVLLQVDGNTIAILQNVDMADLSDDLFLDDEDTQVDDLKNLGTLLDDFLVMGPEHQFPGISYRRDVELGAGDDTAIGHEGTDRVDLGTGDNLAYGNDGADTIRSGNGDSIIYGGAGDDFLDVGVGSNSVHGGDGNDTIRITYSYDDEDAHHQSEVYGDDGDDDIHGASGYAGLFFGGDGNDSINAEDHTGTETADIVDGGAGNDEIFGDNGDTLTGGTGADHFGIKNVEPGDDVVVITDFDPDSGDSLEIQINEFDYETPPGASDISFATAEDGASTMVLLAGSEVALVQGVSDSSLIPVTFSL